MRRFEVFLHRSSHVASREPRIVVQTGGSFSLNPAAFKALGEPEAIELMYDEESKAVGMRPTSKDIKHAYPIRQLQRSTSYMVNARAFNIYYGIDTSIARVYEPTVEDGILVFELAKGTEIAKGRRKLGDQVENDSP